MSVKYLMREEADIQLFSWQSLAV